MSGCSKSSSTCSATKSMNIELKAMENYEAYLGFASSPRSLYIRLKEYDTMLIKLVSDIQTYALPLVPMVPLKNNAANRFKVGDICVARYEKDELYHRVCIRRVICNELTGTVIGYTCFFVDYGDTQCVEIEYVCPITDKLIKQLPFQAIECDLYGVRTIFNQEILQKTIQKLVDLFQQSDCLNIAFVEIKFVQDMKSHVIVYTEKPTLTDKPTPVNDLLENFVKEQMNGKEENFRFDEEAYMYDTTMKDYSYRLEELNIDDFDESDISDDMYVARTVGLEDNTPKEARPASKNKTKTE